MRVLTKRQKKLLDTWFEENKTELKGEMFFDLEQNDLFPSQLRQKLIEINDAESLYQNVNRYISDKISALLYG